MRSISKRDTVREIVVKNPQLVGLHIGEDVFKNRDTYCAASAAILTASLKVKLPIERVREDITSQIIETIPTRNGIKRQIVAEAFGCHL